MFSKTTLIVLMAFASQCFAKASFMSSAEALEAVQSHIEELHALRTRIDDFNGAFADMLAIQNDGYSLLSGSRESRSMAKSMQNFTVDEENSGRAHVIRFMRAFTEVLHSTYIIKRVPYGAEYTQRVVEQAVQEKDQWEELLASKASPEAYQIFIPDLEEGQMEHNNLRKALSG
ncbi:hypothetical protein BDV38DRAFT_289056 [Aspergillus pseudotamarii]|uniref:Hydrophobic surface binding protein A-domain-containing protein n=1 Tax=Aspergillus pseudotamarii TaxID=132259 RepID=A0A5N6SCF8_ASPPS|nr:uncharacterized protein BDV38DRAFT_289056 [Aspergillus pseudotamarii]KAE8131073.1 hypothetical protein BDV38DRAFT_289056 [Aspergillus pseudotamarii]